MVKSTNSWSEDFAAQLRSSGVEKFCISINLDFDEVFLAPARNSSLEKNPYENFQWVVYPYSLISTGVLHSFSNDAQLRKELPWEEWLQWEENRAMPASIRFDRTQIREFLTALWRTKSIRRYCLDKSGFPLLKKLSRQNCFSCAPIFSYARETGLKAIVVSSPLLKQNSRMLQCTHAC